MSAADAYCSPTTEQDEVQSSSIYFWLCSQLNCESALGVHGVGSSDDPAGHAGLHTPAKSGKKPAPHASSVQLPTDTLASCSAGSTCRSEPIGHIRAQVPLTSTVPLGHVLTHAYPSWTRTNSSPNPQMLSHVRFRSFARLPSGQSPTHIESLGSKSFGKGQAVA